MTVTVDKYTRCILTVIAGLLTVVAVGLWFETPDVVTTAQARIPDSGMQLRQLVDHAQQIDDSIGDLTELLASGQVKVQIVKSAANEKPAMSHPTEPADKNTDPVQ